MRYPHVPFALLSCLLAGCSNDPAAGDQVTQTIVYLRPDDAPVVKIEYIDRSLALARLEEEEAFTRSESIAEGIGTATSALSTSDCNAASLRLFDTLVGESVENQVCFVGTGTVNLATIPRGSNGNWAGAVKSIRPSFTQVGTGNVGGLLSPSSCTTYDCPSHHFTQNVWVNANAAGQTADLVTLYELRAPRLTNATRTVNVFGVADRNATTPEVQDLAPDRSFVWSGDRFTSDWTQSTGAGIVGHYIGMNMLDFGDFARCQTNTDCSLLPGYSCGSLSGSTNHLTRYYDGDTVCLASQPQLRVCSNDDGCRIDPSDTSSPKGTCSGGKCYLSYDQKRIIEYGYWNAVHPDWILYKCGPGGTPLPQTIENVAWPDVGPQVPFDFTNPQVVAELLQRIRSFSDYEDYSALSVDAVRIANNNGSCGVFVNGVWQQKFGGNTGYDPSCQNPSYPGYCDPAWTQAAERWLERLRDEMHKDGKRLHVNMSYAGESSPYYPLALDATLERIFDIVDGVMDERGFNRNRCGGYSYDGEHACTGSTVNFDDWSSEHAYIAALEQRSKPYYVKTAFGPFPTPANIEWALANYLVANKGRTSIYVTPLEDNDGLWSFSQLELSLGLPCGLAIEDGDKVTRRYESGLVVVHKGAPISPSVTETLSPNRDYYAFDPVSGLYDAPVSGSVVLPAQSARVLFIDGAPTCN